MTRFLTLTLVACLAALPGCKIVHESEFVEAIPDGPDGDAARNAARLEETFDSRLMPLITDRALSVRDLRAALARGLDTAGQDHGNQGSGRGAAWIFPIGDRGTVIAAKLETSARTVSLDTDADGAADVTVQLGPVIRGTALRDAAPFYDFDDFRDQIEFAKLARAINDRIKPGLVVPEGDLAGKPMSFLGVTPLKKPDGALVVTPVSIGFDE